MARRYLRGLEPEGKLETVGGKRVGLESLAGMGLRVPRTFICSAAAHRHFSNEGTRDRVCSRLRHELALTGLCDAGDVAVRS